jgi:hypothetical protein
MMMTMMTVTSVFWCDPDNEIEERYGEGVMTAAAQPLVVPAVLEFLAGTKSLLIDGHWVQAASGRMNDANAWGFRSIGCPVGG